MLARSITVVFVAMAATAACGPGDRNGGNGGGGGGGGGLEGGDSGAGANCSESAKLVYTVDENNKFSQFDPATKTFKDLGSLSCPAMGGATPFSMGVDRNTIAWVLYSDGELFRVDVVNGLACTKTTWHSTAQLTQFGMGFSTDVKGGTDDTLFVAGGASPAQISSTLAKLDTGAFTSTTMGTVQGWPELTGNSNAELWGWFPSDPNGTSTPRVEQIDKATGSPIKTYMLPSLVGPPMAWAFAYWGGDYWIFLAKGLEFNTTVYQIDGTNGSIKGSTPATGRLIVGAGVSTCAPTVIL